MFTTQQIYEFRKQAEQNLIDDWGSAGYDVIIECAKITPFDGNFDDFLKHCFAQGGNWGGMLLTGINELAPNVWEAIPENMGNSAFFRLCDVCKLMGVRTWETKE